MLNLDSMHFPYASCRHLVYGTRGMVATSHQLATQVGLDILQKGGNAIDAALAVAAALTVVDPANNGVGGDCFAIISQKDKPLVGLNSSGFSPALLTPEAVSERGFDKMPMAGWLTTTVPGAPAGWAAMHERYATLPMTELFAPAIRLAEEGYALSADNADLLNFSAARVEENLAQFPEVKTWYDVFCPRRAAFHAGERYAVPELGQTLRRIAETNAKDFYHGELAERISAYSEATGGFIRREDLADYEPRWVTPVSTNYRGYDVWELPPNGQGITALMALNILESFEFDSRDSERTLHLQMEAIKLAFTDALEYIADPNCMKRSVEELLDKRYAAARRALITDTAQVYHAGTPIGSDTVYFCVADGEGNSVSWIQSIFKPFGSCVTVPETGICLQNRASCFSTVEGHVNRVGGRKYPYHTIIPAFLTRDGQPIGPFGIMGGYMQPQAHVQFVMNMVDFGLNPQAALDAPRFCWTQGLKFDMEPRYDSAVIGALRRRGHDIRIVTGRQYGRGQAIFRTPYDTLCGATEPRSDGSVLGR